MLDLNDGTIKEESTLGHGRPHQSAFVVQVTQIWELIHEI